MRNGLLGLFPAGAENSGEVNVGLNITALKALSRGEGTGSAEGAAAVHARGVPPGWLYLLYLLETMGAAPELTDSCREVLGGMRGIFAQLGSLSLTEVPDFQLLAFCAACGEHSALDLAHECDPAVRCSRCARLLPRGALEELAFDMLRRLFQVHDADTRDRLDALRPVMRLYDFARAGELLDQLAALC